MSEQVPLYILNKNAKVPIPGHNYTLVVPNGSPQYPASGSSDHVGSGNNIILGFFAEEETGIHLQGELLDHIHSIGLYGELVSLQASVSESTFIYQITDRVLIFDIFRAPSGSQHAKWQKVIDLDLDVSPRYVQQFNAVVAVLHKCSSFFSREVGRSLEGSNDLIPRMNIIAEACLQGKNKQWYVLERSNEKRTKELIKTLSRSLPAEAIPEIEFARPKQKSNGTAASTKASDPPVKEKSDLETLVDRVRALSLPERAKGRVSRDLDKLQRIEKSSTEFYNTYEYLNWIADLPWSRSPPKDLPLKALQGILDKSHSGIQQVKDQVIQHCVIESLTKGSLGTVMCFIGPPGTGKTSICKSIAQAMQKPLGKISLGGVVDPADIRGHRRSYIGARPGRIITELNSMKSSSGLIVLDEIDKMGAHRGDPASALLEVLDPEQNREYVDHYLEVPFDLSGIMWICTANYLEQIPPALKDRMDLVHFRLYTEPERYQILVDHLLPSTLTKYCLGTFDIEFPETVLRELTKETSLRKIEQNLSQLLRKAAVDLVLGEQSKVVVTYTGPERNKPLGFSR